MVTGKVSLAVFSTSPLQDLRAINIMIRRGETRLRAPSSDLNGKNSSRRHLSRSYPPHPPSFFLCHLYHPLVHHHSFLHLLLCCTLLFFPFLLFFFCVNPCKAASFTGRCCFQRRQIKDILLSMDSKDETPFLPRSRLFHPIDMNLSLSSTPFPDSFPPLPNSFPPLHSLTPFLFSFPTSPFAHTLSLLTLPF